jgi:two-component system sensor histidine kinase TctE
MEWVPEALHKDVDLGYAGPPTPVLIEGDELLLAEMLNNLIDNALRYGAVRGGTITVRLTEEAPVELSIEDDGPGIPENERERVFERFHRVPGSAPGGCGLGLAIVWEIAQAHHAEVYVDVPESGRGTAIRVRFSEDPASTLSRPVVRSAAGMARRQDVPSPH